MSDIHSTRAPEAVGPFPHAKRVGDLLFLSGIGPRTRDTKAIPGVTLAPDGSVESYDFDVQCRACIENVRTVMEDAGVPFENIVDVLCFLTDMKRDFKAFNRIYGEHFAGEGRPNPTRTTIEVGSLPTPIAVELKVIARV